LLGKSAAERVKTLERYPDLPHLPTDLLYESALNRAEEGNYVGAIASFRNRFFGREEGGINVRQVWIEVRLQQALNLAHSGGCNEATTIARALGSAFAGLAFTEDGLRPFLDSARTQFLLGKLFTACNEKNAAEQSYRLAAKASRSSDTVWAWASARELSGQDDAAFQKRLAATLVQAQSSTETNPRSSWAFYSLGLVQSALHQEQEAAASLRESLLLPDSQMAHHLARLALRGTVR
jgi:tetratricopeptide (TPR) repeat protein